MKFIAEVGSNWKTYEDCIKAVSLAKESGAHAVKFQAFTHEELYGERISVESRYAMPKRWLKALKAEADRVEIEFMCTAFSPSGYDEVDQYVARHKIASAEITALDILEKVNSFKKPVLLSTGGATLDEIKTATECLRDCEVTILFCVADYPAKVVNFDKMLFLKNYFGRRYSYGYSDHSIDVLNIPQKASLYGSMWLEKHVNFFDYADTPDAGHSISKDEFRLMVDNCWTSVSPSMSDSLCDVQMRSDWKRRWIETSDGRSGFYRPLK